MSQYGFYCDHCYWSIVCHSCQVWHWSIEYWILCLSMDSIVIIAVRSDTGVLYVSVWILLLSQLSGLVLEYCTSQNGLYCIIAVRSSTGVLYVSVWIILLSQLSGLALEYCTSQYGLYCYHSCQVQHWIIVRLSMDYIFIIALRSGTGVYCYHSCQYWSIVCLSMDSIVNIAVRSGTGLLYVSVWIILLSQLSGLALEYCMSQYGLYCYHSCQVWHWSIVCLSMDSIVIIAVRSGTGVLYVSMDSIVIIAVRFSTGVLYVSVWIIFLSQLSGLALEYCMSQYGFYCMDHIAVRSGTGVLSIVCLSMDSIVIIAVRSGTGVLYVSVWILL